MLAAPDIGAKAQQGQDAPCAEGQGFVETERQFKAEACPGGVPHPVRVARLHLETINPGFEVGVEGRTSRSGIHPFRFEAFEPVAILNLLRRLVIQRRIINFQVAGTRFKDRFLIRTVSRPLMRTRSTDTIRGWGLLGTLAGSITMIPLELGNQIRPSNERHPE